MILDADLLRQLIIVDNAPHDDRFTLYVLHETVQESHILIVPPILCPDVFWTDEMLRSGITEIFPSASRFSAKDENGTFTVNISGSDRVLLTLMERGEEPFCTECEGGGWILANIPTMPPPSFVECLNCGNPFDFPCP